jgi:hypothetical protein
MSTPIVDNEGIGGGPFLTMQVAESAGFTADDVDDNLTACRVSDDNEASKGAAGDKLFGKVVWASSELVSGTTRPVSVAVQARGVARFVYDSPAPTVNSMVELAGGGKVRLASADADLSAGGHLGRGQVVAVNATAGTCDVWLG